MGEGDKFLLLSGIYLCLFLRTFIIFPRADNDLLINFASNILEGSFSSFKFSLPARSTNVNYDINYSLIFNLFSSLFYC
jgi:hypothetical protein